MWGLRFRGGKVEGLGCWGVGLLFCSLHICMPENPPRLLRSMPWLVDVNFASKL